MSRVRGGVVTNYGADLTQPAWLYIVIRDLGRTGQMPWLTRALGRRPEATALAIFAVGTTTEVSQRYWPGGVFGGRFDPYDIGAFGAGIGVCYVVDKYVTRRRGPGATQSSTRRPN